MRKQQTPASKRQRPRYHVKYVIFIITLPVIIVLGVVGILNPNLSVYVLLLTMMTVLINVLQWLFPVPVAISEDPAHVVAGKIDQLPGILLQPPPDVQARPGPVHATSVFFCNEPLPNIQEFHGRIRESNTIIGRVRRGASTSLIGPRRIGKTWFLQYIKLSFVDDDRFLIGYLDVSAPSCKTVNQFTNLALEALGATDTHVRGLNKLESFVKVQRQRNRIPVLLIDEFEGFASSPEQFDLDFFTGLRSVAGAGLVLVTVSRSSLLSIVTRIAGKDASSSPFFNIFMQVTLKPFNKNEAEDFVSKKGQLAGFDIQECNALLQYGQIDKDQWPPLHLQLTGNLLLEDKGAAQRDPHMYRPGDPLYWEEFKERLQEIQGAIQ